MALIKLTLFFFFASTAHGLDIDTIFKKYNSIFTEDIEQRINITQFLKFLNKTDDEIQMYVPKAPARMTFAYEDNATVTIEDGLLISKPPFYTLLSNKPHLLLKDGKKVNAILGIFGNQTFYCHVNTSVVSIVTIPNPKGSSLTMKLTLTNHNEQPGLRQDFSFTGCPSNASTTYFDPPEIIY